MENPIVHPAVKNAEELVYSLMENHLPTDFHFHSFEHTRQVVEAANTIAVDAELPNDEQSLLLIAAWFHDTGYIDNPSEHEVASAERAARFMTEKGFTAEQIEKVKQIILATRIPQNPQSLTEQILCDADLSHLGRDIFWDLSGKFRLEQAARQQILLSEQEWIQQEIDFLNNHQFHTPAAQKLYQSKKEKHVKQLQKRLERLFPSIAPAEPKLKVSSKKKKKKKKSSENPDFSQYNLGRGVETMYRNAYRTHINLSSIADNKANIMLSINAIIVSITVSTLIPRFTENTLLIAPTISLLTICLLAIIFATLSTRPKVTEGRFTRADIENRQANLLFFGNFYKMDFKDFQWGMMEMIKDNEFLYTSMTKDLYYLGIVLAKKYTYLRICYNIFMFGMIFTVLFFAAAFIL